MENSSPISSKCMSLCNNNLFNRSSDYRRLTIDTVDSVSRENTLNTMVYPGQAVKIITESSGEHTVMRKERDPKKEVCTTLRPSKSFSNIQSIKKEDGTAAKNPKRSNNLKDCKSCDENLIKFIFTEHGIQVISDIETIV